MHYERKIQALVNRLKDEVKDLQSCIPAITEKNMDIVVRNEGFVEGLRHSITRIEMLLPIKNKKGKK
tara:strand:- start:46 stop:246 length:201 start_codon:yes stop_codon:yes gene_type:complete